MQSVAILVVDDEQHLRDGLVTRLRADGFCVHAANGSTRIDLTSREVELLYALAEEPRVYA